MQQKPGQSQALTQDIWPGFDPSLPRVDQDSVVKVWVVTADNEPCIAQEYVHDHGLWGEKSFSTVHSQQNVQCI